MLFLVFSCVSSHVFPHSICPASTQTKKHECASGPPQWGHPYQMQTTPCYILFVGVGVWDMHIYIYIYIALDPWRMSRGLSLLLKQMLAQGRSTTTFSFAFLRSYTSLFVNHHTVINKSLFQFGRLWRGLESGVFLVSFRADLFPSTFHEQFISQ